MENNNTITELPIKVIHRSKSENEAGDFTHVCVDIEYGEGQLEMSYDHYDTLHINILRGAPYLFALDNAIKAEIISEAKKALLEYEPRLAEAHSFWYFV